MSEPDQISSSSSSYRQPIHLVIVQRDRFATFGLLAEAFADERNVRLIWDRRRGDRRRSTGSPAVGDQRRRDRRRAAAAAWGNRDYLVLSAQDRDAAVDQSVTRPAEPPPTQGVLLAREDIQRDIEAAGRSDLSVLITGGDMFSRKSLARQIHRRSDRRDGPVIAVDGRLAVELFGAIGSDQRIESRVLEMAQRESPGPEGPVPSTLVIEEVASLTWEEQTELLAFLDRRTRRHGGIGRATFDPRLITLTECCLFDNVVSSRFRSDLFYRLNLIHVALPSGMVERAES